MLDNGTAEAPVDALVADIYRAAAGAVPWARPLEGLQLLFRAWGVHLYGVSRAAGSIDFSYEAGGFPPDGVLAYLRHYHLIDPRAALALSAPLGAWFSCHQAFDDQFVARDPFYQEFLIPYGGRYVSGAVVHQDSEVACLVGIHRGHGMQPLTDAELALARRLGGHLGNALALWRRDAQRQPQQRLGAAVLEQLPHPVLLLDEQQQVLHVNGAGQRWLQREPRLRLVGRQLRFGSPQAHEALLLALRRLQLAGEGAALQPPGTAQPREIVRIHDARGRHPLALLISPLRPDQTLGAFGQRPLAMVLVHDLRQTRPVDRLLAAELYQLTPAEAAVAVAIAEGHTPRQVAARQGVALTTVRSQLRSVCQKLGVRRQAEVALALAALPALAAKS